MRLKAAQKRAVKEVRLLNADVNTISFKTAEQILVSVLLLSRNRLWGPGHSQKSEWRKVFSNTQDRARRWVYREGNATAVRICPNCNRAFLVKKSRKQKWCDNDCRRSGQNTARRGSDYYKKN